MNHLSDEEIQSYLDGNTHPKSNHMENHLKSCVHCQNILNQYRDLYTDLKREPQLQLSEEFVPAIMDKLTSTPKRGLLFRFAKNLLFSMGFLWLTTIIISVAYMINSKPWEEIHNQSIDLISEVQMTFFVSINRMLSDLIGKPDLLLFAGLTLIIVALIDRLIFQPKFSN